MPDTRSLPYADQSPMARVSRELQDVMKELDERLEKIAGTRVAFSIFVYTEGRMNYGGNLDREEALHVIEQWCAAKRAGMPDVPAHKIS